LKLKYEKLLSTFAFNCNLRRFTKAAFEWFQKSAVQGEYEAGCCRLKQHKHIVVMQVERLNPG